MSDLIYIQDAIIELVFNEETKDIKCEDMRKVLNVLKKLPSTEPKLDNENGELIYRKDALKGTGSLYTIHGSEGSWVDMKDVFKMIENLPSASPDLSTFSDKLWKIAYERGKEEGRKKGKWIYGEKSGQDGWYCSECGGFIPWYYDFYGLANIDFIEDFKTCPFCDSKMVSYTGADTRGDSDDL